MTRPGSARTALAIAALAVVVAGCAGTVATPSGGVSQAPSADRFAGAPEGTATVTGAVQRIAVDVSQGSYRPAVLNVKAGLPVEIAFGQGQGCLSRVQFPDFGIDQDLTAGGATVKLPALKAGQYEFHCGMSMVYGKVVAR